MEQKSASSDLDAVKAKVMASMARAPDQASWSKANPLLHFEAYKHGLFRTYPKIFEEAKSQAKESKSDVLEAHKHAMAVKITMSELRNYTSYGDILTKDRALFDRAAALGIFGDETATRHFQHNILTRWTPEKLAAVSKIFPNLEKLLEVIPHAWKGVRPLVLSNNLKPFRAMGDVSEEAERLTRMEIRMEVHRHRKEDVWKARDPDSYAAAQRLGIVEEELASVPKRGKQENYTIAVTCQDRRVHGQSL